MSTTLIVVASATPATILGALAMWLPAKWARDDAQQYRDAGDRTFGAAESLADEVERTRNLPWHYAAELPPAEVCRTNSIAPHGPVVAHDRNGEPRCQMCAEFMGLHLDAEVLHVEHPTGELSMTVEETASNLRKLIADLDATADDAMDRDENRCPECRLHSAHKPTCSRPVSMPWQLPSDAMALSDRPAEDEDEVGDEQPGEGRWSWLRFVGATLLFPFAWLLFKLSRLADWWREEVLDRFKSADELDAEFRTPHDEAEESAVEIEAWVQANPPTNPTYKSHRCLSDEHSTRDPGYRSRHTERGYETGVFPAINAEIPAQRSGDADADA